MSVNRKMDTEIAAESYDSENKQGLNVTQPNFTISKNLRSMKASAEGCAQFDSTYVKFINAIYIWCI